MPQFPPLGLRDGEVVLAGYDERWPSLFNELSQQLREALGPAIIAVHHVGSTAIPGLCAKPILDVLVSVSTYERGLALAPELSALGFEHRPNGEIADRHFFRRRRNGVRTCHLSLAEPDSQHHRATLAFRDALRSDPGLAAAYADLKRQLAARFPFDRPAYIDGKSDFVLKVVGGRLSDSAQGTGAST